VRAVLADGVVGEPVHFLHVDHPAAETAEHRTTAFCAEIEVMYAGSNRYLNQAQRCEIRQ